MARLTTAVSDEIPKSARRRALKLGDGNYEPSGRPDKKKPAEAG
jgi:hypothetical protein